MLDNYPPVERVVWGRPPLEELHRGLDYFQLIGHNQLRVGGDPANWKTIEFREDGSYLVDGVVTNEGPSPLRPAIAGQLPMLTAAAESVVPAAPGHVSDGPKTLNVPANADDSSRADRWPALLWALMATALGVVIFLWRKCHSGAS